MSHDATVAGGAEQDLRMFRTMQLIERFETTVSELFAAGELPGFVHLYLGQEAIAAGVCASLNDDDYITSTHRGHGHLLAKGGDPVLMMAELFGKATGYCHGKGGSMHIADPGLGILGANGIVGAGYAIATGAAFSARRAGRGQVAICFFGDGATGEGSFSESLNLAAALRLPVIFVCENNGYAVSTPLATVRGNTELADLGPAHGVPSAVVDGNDVRAVRDAAASAIARARSGDGPTLIEARAHRQKMHFEGEPNTYIARDELAAWLARDPVRVFENVLRSEGRGDEVDRAIAEIDAEVARAVDIARAEPDPTPADALTDVYA